MIISFEGLPGAGKTTTAQLLAAVLKTECVVESTQQHPFLESVYRDDTRHDLEVELAFLLLHASAWRVIDRSIKTVTDFTPVKDLIFARDTLTGADLQIFEELYRRLHGSYVPPDLVIYLRATPELALARVRTRYEREEHRHFEKEMQFERLRRIETQYEAHLDQLGDAVLTLDLAHVLKPGEPEQVSKDRVAQAALALLDYI